MSDKRILGFLRTKNPVIREMFSEFIGTLILILLVDCSVAVQVLSRRPFFDLTSVGIANGVGLMLAVLLGAKVSGGHVNPVVTLALATVGKFPWKKVPHYFIAQYLGAFVAGAITYGNYYNAINDFDGGQRSAFYKTTSTAGILTTSPQPYLTIWETLSDQILVAALLLLGINCLTDKKNLNVPEPVVPIGLCLLLSALIIAFGHNCGPALNPARDISGRLFAYMVGYGSDVWSPINNVYWFIGGLIGPHLGGIVGQWLYYLLIELHLEDGIQWKNGEA